MWETADGDPPLVDEDWYAMCQTIYNGVEGPAWKVMHILQVATILTCSFFSARVSICNHSYSRGHGTDLISDPVTVVVVARIKLQITRKRHGKTVSNDNMR